MTPAGAAPPRELATEDLVAPFGPEHPTVPGLRLILTLDGEQVGAAEVELGYRHRGLEKLAERGWDTAAGLAPRVDPLAPHAGASALARALEALGGVQVPMRAARLRVAVLELERAGSHLGALGRLAALLGLAPAARLAGDLYGRVERAGHLVAGGAGGGCVVVGGVAGAPPQGVAAELARQVDALRPGLAALERQLGRSWVAGRLDGLAALAPDRAVAVRASGPVLRACGVRHDARAGDPTYAELAFEPVVAGAGDVLARCRVRVAEVGRALELAVRAAAAAGDGSLRTPAPPPPSGMASGRVEGPRGELAALVASDGDGAPRRVAFRGPSLAHAVLLPELLVGCRYADVPLAVASLDLSVEEAER